MRLPEYGKQHVTICKNIYIFLCRSEGICYLQLHRHLGVKYFLNMVEEFNYTGANVPRHILFLPTLLNSLTGLTPLLMLYKVWHFFAVILSISSKFMSRYSAVAVIPAMRF
jgi:hypothetical protein